MEIVRFGPLLKWILDAAALLKRCRGVEGMEGRSLDLSAT